MYTYAMHADMYNFTCITYICIIYIYTYINMYIFRH